MRQRMPMLRYMTMERPIPWMMGRSRIWDKNNPNTGWIRISSRVGSKIYKLALNKNIAKGMLFLNRICLHFYLVGPLHNICFLVDNWIGRVGCSWPLRGCVSGKSAQNSDSQILHRQRITEAEENLRQSQTQSTQPKADRVVMSPAKSPFFLNWFLKLDSLCYEEEKVRGKVFDFKGILHFSLFDLFHRGVRSEDGYHVVKVNSLDATPPKLIAKTISNTVMKSAFFQPNSLTRAAIVAIQGM